MGHVVAMMSLRGKTLFARGMFYYSPKIHSQLSFHLSERAARRLHAALEVKGVMLAEAVQLAILSDTKCVNRRRQSFTSDARPGQKHSRDRQGRGKPTSKLKERCHEICMST